MKTGACKTDEEYDVYIPSSILITFNV